MVRGMFCQGNRAENRQRNEWQGNVAGVIDEIDICWRVKLLSAFSWCLCADKFRHS